MVKNESFQLGSVRLSHEYLRDASLQNEGVWEIT